MDEDRTVKKGVRQLVELVVKLRPEEFMGVCKILGIQIYREDEEVGALDEDEKENEEVVQIDSTSTARGRSELRDSTSNKPKKPFDKNLNKTPRPTELIISDVIESLNNLNHTRRKNLKRLLKAATKPDKKENK